MGSDTNEGNMNYSWTQIVLENCKGDVLDNCEPSLKFTAWPLAEVLWKHNLRTVSAVDKALFRAPVSGMAWMEQ